MYKYPRVLAYKKDNDDATENSKAVEKREQLTT